MVGRLCKRKIDALDIRGQSYVMWEDSVGTNEMSIEWSVQGWGALDRNTWRLFLPWLSPSREFKGICVKVDYTRLDVWLLLKRLLILPCNSLHDFSFWTGLKILISSANMLKDLSGVISSIRSLTYTSNIAGASTEVWCVQVCEIPEAIKNVSLKR